MNVVQRVAARALVGAAVVVSLACARQTAVVPTAAPAKHYVCPACGASCDLAVYDHPGTCPACGMTLVVEGSPQAQRSSERVAILVFDGAEIIDFTGPWEVFGAAGFDVYAVGATKQPVMTSMGMTVVPRYTFAEAPVPTVLVVPGGGIGGVRHDAATLRFLVETSRRAKQTLSVCNGAFLLASAGLLDGLTATTTYGRLDELHAEFPKVTVISDRRYADNGAVVTAAGLSAGIDGALHVVEKLHGRGAAQSVALGIEYDWRPEGGFVRARLADRVMPDIDARSILGDFTVERNEGTADRWEVAIRGTSAKQPGEVMDALEHALLEKKPWRRTSADATSRAWTFADDEGKPWTARASIDAPPPGQEHRGYVVTLSVQRAP
jgi:putative intracellular protease/amidase